MGEGWILYLWNCSEECFESLNIYVIFLHNPIVDENVYHILDKVPLYSTSVSFIIVGNFYSLFTN